MLIAAMLQYWYTPLGHGEIYVKITHAHTYILLCFDLLAFCGILCVCLWKISCMSDFGISVMVGLPQTEQSVLLLFSEGVV